MKRILPLFIMVDACGWEIVKDDPFVRDVAPHRRRLNSVFGYSSTCVPSILSGFWPVEHRNWCYFVYDPAGSPFRSLRFLRWLPKAITGRRLFRRVLTRLVKARLGFKGYFDLYNIPFRYISLFNFTERKSPLRPQGMNRGTNIFDFLEKRHIQYFGSDPDASEEENREELKGKIEAEAIDFGFIYWPGLDGLLHRVGNQSPEIASRLRMYEEWIQGLLKTAEGHYDEVHLYVFSDHGMANCDRLLDLKSKIDELRLVMGVDYAVVYDSTMARFWFLKPEAKEKIVRVLNGVPEGRVLSDEELERLGTLFPDRYFGELIFLVQEGVLIVPSFMGERPIRAMHGYHPDEKQSFATLMTNCSVPEDVTALPDLYRLMTKEAEMARRQNGEGRAAISASEKNENQPMVTAYD